MERIFSTKLTADDGLKFAALVPVHKDQGELISAMQDIATGAGITLAEVHLSDAQGQTADQFKTMSITLDMSGSYPSLRTFLTNLEAYVRLLNVGSIEVTVDPNSATKLRFAVRADAYFLK